PFPLRKPCSHRVLRTFAMCYREGDRLAQAQYPLAIDHTCRRVRSRSSRLSLGMRAKTGKERKRRSISLAEYVNRCAQPFGSFGPALGRGGPLLLIPDQAHHCLRPSGLTRVTQFESNGHAPGRQLCRLSRIASKQRRKCKPEQVHVLEHLVASRGRVLQSLAE